MMREVLSDFIAYFAGAVISYCFASSPLNLILVLLGGLTGYMIAYKFLK